MKSVNNIFLLSILTFLILASCNKTTQTPSSIRIMSYNIKYDDKTDTVNGWEQRKEQVANLIAFYEPDFLGTQEGLLHQLQFMEERLGSMQWIGVGRGDGKNEGEFSAIFYNTERFELVANSDSTIWLSETPSEPSKSWDAALPRIMTWGKFRDTSTGKEFFVFNTHFDHRGETARAESARLVVETINEVADGLPVILTGDFNAVEDSSPYDILTADSSPLKDTYYKTEIPHVGPLFSYSGFKVVNSDSERRIDYIFVNEEVEVQKHAIISDFREGRYPSDHLPVIADVVVH